MANYVGKTISQLTITEELNRGGAGVVVRAVVKDGHGSVPGNLALKISLPDKPGDGFNKQRLVSEVEVLRKLNEAKVEGIVKIYPMTWERKPTYYANAYELSDKPSNAPWYFAMEFLEGPTLTKHLVKVKRMTLSEVSIIASKVAYTLHRIHKVGFAHNDLKPENIMFRKPLPTGNSMPVLIDFGTAQKLKLVDFDQITYQYSSLEKLEVLGGNKPPETNNPQKSDVWSLGVMFYQMLTGKVPFPGNSPKTVSDSIRNKRPDSIRAVVKDIPESLDKLILHDCLAIQPAHRPPADEIADYFKNLI